MEIPELPSAPEPGGCYESVVVHGGLAYVSGHLPWVTHQLPYTGRVGLDCSVSDAMHAAKASALACLSNLSKALGSLDEIERVLKVTGYVASGPDFTSQTQIIDAASEAIIEILGRRGAHARSSLGVYLLPRNVPVEIDMLCALRRG